MVNEPLPARPPSRLLAAFLLPIPMTEKQLIRRGDWHIASANGLSGRFVAWGKMGPIVADDPVREPGEHVFFEFGETREAAVKRLIDSLGIRE